MSEAAGSGVFGRARSGDVSTSFVAFLLAHGAEGVSETRVDERSVALLCPTCGATKVFVSGDSPARKSA